MYTYVTEILHNAGFDALSSLIAYGVLIVAGIVGCVILRGVIRGVVGRVLARAAKKNVRMQALIDSLLVKRASNIVMPVVFMLLVRDMTAQYAFLGILAEVAFVLVILLIIFSCLKSVGAIYDSYEVSKTFPIHGILQVIGVAVGLVGSIIIIAILIGQSPVVLLGSLGAMTAVTTLIFRDSILGFIAGIQLTTNDMIRIGDWIELPNHSANGFVTDLNMTTVKVENLDKTITTIPAYTLISDSFINWRGMLDTGARRIKRPILIDAASICMCDDVLLARLSGITLIADYLKERLAEISAHNAAAGYAAGDMINGRRLTNLGVFRTYITAYLRQHKQIHQEMTLVVRQLDPTDCGIPMEIIAFATATAGVDFEPIQADIFDHLYAVIGVFGLRVFQRPSGNDVRGNTSNDANAMTI